MSYVPCRSGWPSFIRGIGLFVCAASGASEAARATTPATRTSRRVTSVRIYLPHSAFRIVLARQRLLAVGAVEQFLDELDALEVHQLRVLLEAAVQRHADPPRPRERLGIGHRRFVADDVGRGPRVALGDLELIAVEIAGAIEPGAVVEAAR